MYIADLGYYDRSFRFQGAEVNSAYFEEIESDDWLPEMDFDNPIIQCGECGQYWYFEYAPEESAFPLFGIKRSGCKDIPNKELVSQTKEELSLVAHGGTANERCRMKGCEYKKLKGRELCVHHISFP